jgi:allantoin racemase
MKIGLVGATQAAVAGLGAPPELTAIAAPETEIRAFPTRMPVFAHTPLEFAMQALNTVEAGVAAAAAGCDALVINSFSDYGIAALKAAVGIPVVGAAEATLRFVGTLGPRFSIVTVWPPSLDYMPRQVMRDAGVEAACARIRHVGTEAVVAGSARPDGYVSALQHGKGDIVARIQAACDAAAAEDGVDAIILGCTCMSPIAARLRAAVPVLNPLAVALKVAEMQAALGLRATPAAPLRLQSLARVSAMVAAGAVLGSDGDCAVCAVAAAAE